MQEVAFPRRKGRFDPSSLLVLLLLPGIPLGFTAEDGCEFPETWAGEWFQYGKPNIIINTTTFGDRTCSQKISTDQYVVFSNTDSCYQCMIITSPHENVIQYREGWGEKRGRAEELCLKISSDDILYSMFRVNAKPVPCPFNGPPFTFSYNRGKKECATPPSLAERCTDESKLLLKYQACPDVESTESYTEELQCLAIWNDGRNKYFVGTLERKSPGVPNEKTYRCFLYEEEKNHHSSKVLYSIAQSGDPTCSGLYTVNEGSANIKLTKVDKEHTKCKYPHWVTTHHDWHSLDGTKTYHFTSKNATLKVKALGSNEDTFHEERIICHNTERFDPNDNKLGNKVKLVAHVTSGCDIGYVCMIFHQRDNHIIELQQSSQKAIMPEEACSSSDVSTMPYTTLITSSLHPRKCPHPGRYAILGYASMSNFRRQRRSEKLSKPAKRRTWHDNSEDEECRSTDIQIGCSSPEQNEMIIVNTCEHAEIDYFCHGSWEEKGVWHTIVSQKTPDLGSGLGPTYCFSMRLGEDMQVISDRGSGLKQLPTQHQEQELLLSKPTTACLRNVTKEWVYRLTTQGVCEDLMKAASSAASSFTLSRIILSLSLGTTTLYKLLSSR